MNKIFVLALLAIATGCRFYEVDAGKLYRGPQPTGAEIDQAVQDYGLKTVINLRGENPGADWYEDEKAAALRNGLNMVNIGMSAARLPHKEDLIKLLDALREAPRPIFVHCLRGVDRTGEASAIYEMLYMNKAREVALEMLSFLFLHFEKIMPAKKYFIRDVWQGEEWARKDYDPCSGQYQFYDSENPFCKKGVRPPLTEDEDT